MKRTVYIGAEREQELAALVLQHTIEATASRPVQVFLLHRVNGLSYSEIGETLGISRKTVENLMGRTLQRLRKALRGHIGQSIVVALATRFLAG